MSVVGIKDLKTLLGDDAEQFDFKIITVDNKQFIHMKAKQFLPTDQFNEAHEFVKQQKGWYVSAGKESHFRFGPLDRETPHIPQPEAPSQPTRKQELPVETEADTKRRLLLEGIDLLEKALTKLREAGH